MNFQVDGQFRTRMPGIFAIGDVAAFPLKVHLCLIKQLLPFSLSTSLLFCFLGFWHMFWPNRCMTVQHEWNMLIMLVDRHSIALKHYLVHKLTRISNFLLWLRHYLSVFLYPPQTSLLIISFLHELQIWLSSIFLLEGFWVWRKPQESVVAVFWRQWWESLTSSFLGVFIICSSFINFAWYLLVILLYSWRDNWNWKFWS